MHCPYAMPIVSSDALAFLNVLVVMKVGVKANFSLI